jgi:hypothetical protein
MKWPVRLFAEVVALVVTSRIIPLGRRAQALLKKVLLRRTKTSEIVGASSLRNVSSLMPWTIIQDGKPIITLPPRDFEEITLDFTKEERDVRSSESNEWGRKLTSGQIYNAVEAREKLKLSKFIKAGTVAKKCAFVARYLICFNRLLPQLSCYPCDDSPPETGLQVRLFISLI